MRRISVVGPRGVVLEVSIPTSHAERMRGLLGRDSLGEREALLLERTRSIHTLGMRFPIAVALLDRSSRILAVLRVAPGRVVLPRPRVRHVLECRVDIDLRVGDRLGGRDGPWSGTGMAEELAKEPADDDQGASRRHGQEGERHGEGEGRAPAHPRGEGHRLPTTAVRMDDPEVLEQRAHG